MKRQTRSVNYSFRKFDGSFEETLEKATKAIRMIGFDSLKENYAWGMPGKSQGVDSNKFCMLGACGRPFSPIGKDGPQMYFIVIVRETKDGTIDVETIDPIPSIQTVENSEYRGIAENVRSRFELLIDSF